MRFRPFLYFGASVAAVALVASADYSWAAWRPATCMPAACFCERIAAGTVRQPANAWSSLAFVLVACLVAERARLDRTLREPVLASPLATRAALQALFIGALVVIGFGSAFYHASLTFVGQFFNVFGMYLIGTFILTYNLSRLRRMSARAIVACYVLSNLFLATLLVTVPVLRRYLFGLLIAAALALEAIVRRRAHSTMDTRLLGAAVVALLVSFIIWVVDITHTVCAPASLVQGHALWHLGGALAAGLIYLYYRSEVFTDSR